MGDLDFGVLERTGFVSKSLKVYKQSPIMPKCFGIRQQNGRPESSREVINPLNSDTMKQLGMACRSIFQKFALVSP